MNLDDEITRSLSARAERTSYDVTPLASVEQTARGIRRRRRTLTTAAAAVVVAAIVVPVAALTVGDRSDGTIGPADPPSSSVTGGQPSTPLGYLSGGVFHAGDGTTLDVPVPDVSQVRADGRGGVWVLHAGAQSRVKPLAHVSPTGRVEELGCARSLPVTSPDASVLAVATTSCTGDGQSWTVEVSGAVEGSAEVTGAPQLEGVDSAGGVVYVDHASFPFEVLAVNPVETPATPRVVRDSPFEAYDATHHLFLDGDLSVGRVGATPSLLNGDGGLVATDLDGRTAWTSTETNRVVGLSPDDSAALGGTAVNDPQADVPVLDTATGDVIGTIPYEVEGRRVVTLRWYDDERVLAQLGSGRGTGFVLIDLDGGVEPITFDVAPGTDVLWERR